MNEQLDAILATVQANLVMSFMFFITNIFLIVSLYKDAEKKRRRIPELFELAVKATKQKLKNMGEVQPVPDVPDEILRRFCGELLKDIEGGTAPKDVKLSEGAWIVSRRWQNIGGNSPAQFRKALERLSTKRVTARKNARGDWWLAPPHETIGGKLARLSSSPLKIEELKND